MPNDRTDGSDELVSIPAVAEHAAVSRQAVYRWIALGRLPAIRTDDGPRVDRAALDRLLAERRAAAAVGIRPATVRRWVSDARPR